MSSPTDPFTDSDEQNPTPAQPQPPTSDPSVLDCERNPGYNPHLDPPVESNDSFLLEDLDGLDLSELRCTGKPTSKEQAAERRKETQALENLDNTFSGE